MALVDSLLTAMVRADGDALVMHVGERPIVVSGPKTIDLSVHGMNLGAMVGMLGQLLSGDALASLKEFGAVEHALPARGSDHFSVVAARSGDDIWIEIRRRRELPAVVELSPVDDMPLEQVGTEVAPDDVAALHGETAEPEVAPDDAAALHAEAAEAEAEPVEPEADSAEPEQEIPVESEQEIEGVQAEAAPAESAPAAVSEEAPAAFEPPTVPEVAAVPEAAAVSEPAEFAEPEAPVEEPAPTGVEVAPVLRAEAVEASPEFEPVAIAEDEVRVIEDAVRAEQAAASAVAVTPAEVLAADTAALAEVPEPESISHEAPAVEIVSQAEEEPMTPPAEPVEAVAEDLEVPAEEAVAPAASAGTTLDDSSLVEEPAPAMASASASAYPVSTVTPVVPMDPARHTDHSAGGPPSRPAAPSAPPAAAAMPGPGGDEGTNLPDVPVTRTVRIEVPARASSARTTGIDRLLRAADGVGASELFLVSQARPYVRVGGNVRPLQEEAPLVPSDIEALIADVTPEPWREAVRRGDPAEWLIELSDVGRVRCSTFRDQRGPGANFHFAFLRAVTADDLQLSADTRMLATEPDGLIVIAGGAGSDVSAIVAAFVDILNHQRADYVITLEPQVRVLHVNREALVSQREVGHDQARIAAAARAALREEPDVLVIEGVASGEVAQLAIDAASQNRLVIASIDAPSAPRAVQRLVELLPADQRQAARGNLARCFRGAVAQLMLRKATGGRIAARELLSGSRAVAQALAEGDLSRLSELLDAQGGGSTVPLADTIVEYVRAGVVDVREALRKTPDAADLVGRLKNAGVGLGAVERWQ